MNNFFKDFREALRKTPVWWYMSRQDLIGRYRRTTLGPWWITIGTGIGIGAMGTIWGLFFGMNLQKFFPYLGAGYVLWTFISSVVTDSPMIFIEIAPMLRSIKIPILIYIFTGVMRHVYTLFHNFFIVVIIFAVFKVYPKIEILLFIPGVILLLISAYLSSLILAFFGARFRDVSHIINSFMTFIFLLTPIMWRPEILSGKKALLVYLNPFSYYLAILRDPLLGQVPDMTYYYGVFVMIGIMTIAAVYIYKRLAHRIIFWV